MVNIMVEKEVLRKKYIELRKSIINKEEKSNNIFLNLIDLSAFKNSNIIGIYCSMIDEVDTYRIIKYCLLDDKEVLVPKLNNNGTMNFYKIDDLNELSIKNKFGISEPISNIKQDNMDLIVVPGICFDSKLNRVGFGKGYYDKYLMNRDIYKIGLCFDWQVLDSDFINVNKYDIPMDIVVTDKRKIKNIVK